MSRHVADGVGRRIWLGLTRLPGSFTSAARPSPASHPVFPSSVPLSRAYSHCGFSIASNTIPPTFRIAARAFSSTATTTAIREGSTSKLARAAWTRAAHTSSRRRRGITSRRNKSSVSDGTKSRTGATGAVPKPDPSKAAPSEKLKESSKAAAAANGQPLLNRLPHLHRPSKEELLAAATGAWSRFKVHFKWFSIKSGRKFNTDDISAFFSWIIVGHVVWIIVGTTTFFSLAIFLVNTVFAQETLAGWIGNYLTSSSGVRVVFESAIVPKWGDGVISFKNVFVSRRPGQGQAKVSKGQQAEAAAAAAAAAAKDRKAEGKNVEEEEDTNYTQFDLSLDTVNVTLSFTKWFNGKGLLADVEIKGIRGVVDRTSVHSPEEYVDPRTYKHEHNPGDFELDSFRMEDLLVTIYQPNDFRPYPVSIYSCELPRLRKQWLFYDFLSANMMSGSFDNSLFTIHPRQMHNYTGQKEGPGVDGEPTQWKKQSRIRIDGLNIDHLNRGIEGPFGWIHEGNVDIVADIMFPAENDGSIAKVMSDFYDRMEATVTSTSARNVAEIKAQDEAEDRESFDVSSLLPQTDDENRFMVMDLRVHLNDVRAAVPLFTNDISYVNNALIRPIVAYINSKRTFIPVNCRVVKRACEFDGSWTIYDSGLMDDLSREMYEAFARDVLDDNQARKRRFKKVGIWTLQLAAQALFIGLAGNIA